MASTVMATRPITSPSLSSPRKLKLKLSIRASAQSKPNSSTSIPNQKLLFSVPSIAMLAAASPLPAFAAQIEKAALFDFNLTLPIIAIEFLLLMVALDKLYFSPLGKFMDERDANIRAQLNEVKDTSSEVKQLEEQAAAIMRAARAEIAAALNKMKKEVTAEMEAKLAEEQQRVEAELVEAIANLEKEKEEAIRILDAQIDALSDEIVRKVLPVN